VSQSVRIGRATLLAVTSPVAALLDDAVAARPGAPALAFAGRRLSYAQLCHDVDRFAGALAAAGLKPGDRVGVLLPNCPQQVIAFFATVRLGGTAVLVNPLATEETMREQLAGVVAVVCLDQVMSTLDAVRAQLPVQRVFVTALVDYYPWTMRLRLRLPTPSARRRSGDRTTHLVMAPDVVRFAAALKAAQPAPQADVDPADVAIVGWTAGTTEEPRAVELSHANLAANAMQLRELLGGQGVPSTLAALPLFHVFGLSLGLLTTIAMGGKVVLLPRFDPGLVFSSVEAEKPSLFPGVPPMFQSLLSAPDVTRRDLRSIRTCICVGMRLSTETVERFERVSGARMLEAYGSTETGITHCNSPNGRRLGSVGPPLPDTEARILDLKDPEGVAGPGERGELSVRGPQVAESDWFATGDLASVDDRGYYTVFGRKVDAFVAGLARVYPNELEDLIRALPGVADVCVVGARRGRKVEMSAYVVRYPDADIDGDVIREQLAKKLPAARVPTTIEMCETLPRSVLGHPLRREL
jgi:long-chain acyl-CoA synthetase